MGNMFRIFLIGLVISAVISLIGGTLIPWGAGGLGIVVGVLIVRAAGPDGSLRGYLLGAVGFMLALYLIENQYYNPDWLTRAVLFCRVFVSHSLLLPTLVVVKRYLNDS